MTATQGAVAARAASASEKLCLHRAKVERLAAVVTSPRGRLGFHPVTEPRFAQVPVYAVDARG